tara:strand:+ start:3094 stop:4482 length:1389 start_codon:yes stop_codon:yes gene_type:complete
MADAKSQVYLGREGSGLAQVFDTSGLVDFELQMRDRKKKEFQDREKRFKESLVDIETSKLWSRDLPQFNDKYNQYLDFVKTNSDALQTPSKNTDVYLQKRRLEQELKQFASSSASSQEFYNGAQTLMFKNPDKFKEIYGKDGMSQFDKFSKTAGDFDNDYQRFFTPETQGLASQFKNIVGSVPKTGMVTTEQTGASGRIFRTTSGGSQSREDVESATRQTYRTDPAFKRSIDSDFEQNNGTFDGVQFETAEDYAAAMSAGYIAEGSFSRTSVGAGGGLEINFGGGGKRTVDAIDSSAQPNKVMGVGDDKYEYTAYQQQSIPKGEFNIQSGADVRKFDGSVVSGRADVINLKNGVAQIALIKPDGSIASQQEEDDFRAGLPTAKGYTYQAMLLAETSATIDKVTDLQISDSEGIYVPLDQVESSVAGASKYVEGASEMTRYYQKLWNEKQEQPKKTDAFGNPI